jgi:nifR3 family TIM-barrel protein
LPLLDTTRRNVTDHQTTQYGFPLESPSAKFRFLPPPHASTIHAVSLPWFTRQFPLYVAPMAGVTDSLFRGYCKEFGADVVVTEFVSADGIFRRNERTLEYLEFHQAERPVGIQLFGADPEHLGEAARMAIDWKQPDFIDINFGCPVNKVVSKNGGSSLLRDCPLLEAVAKGVVKGAGSVPVTAKIRIGWDEKTVNATTTARILEQSGIQAIAVHGRTKSQGYSGSADWQVIAEVARSVSVPVIGNGDLSTGADVVRRKNESGVAGAMIGRAAMCAPWVFREMRAALLDQEAPSFPLEAKWNHIVRHCRDAVARSGSELHVMHSMRSRLMAYSRGMDRAKWLRSRFSHIESLMGLEDVAQEHLAMPRESLEAADESVGAEA